MEVSSCPETSGTEGRWRHFRVFRRSGRDSAIWFFLFRMRLINLPHASTQPKRREQNVTHPSTSQTQRCLTSVISRELVCQCGYRALPNFEKDQYNGKHEKWRFQFQPQMTSGVYYIPVRWPTLRGWGRRQCGKWYFDLQKFLSNCKKQNNISSTSGCAKEFFSVRLELESNLELDWIGIWQLISCQYIAFIKAEWQL